MINGAQHIFMEKAGVVTRLEKRLHRDKSWKMLCSRLLQDPIEL